MPPASASAMPSASDAEALAALEHIAGRRTLPIPAQLLGATTLAPQPTNGAARSSHVP
jgi:hypothetical protein